MAPAFSVTKSVGALVGLCGPAPSGSLQLSSIDGYFIPGSFVETMLVFKHGRGAAEVVRRALSRALVPYYPLAGRLVRSERGEVEVACTGDGVWFVEASADCSLEDVDWLEGYPRKIPREELLAIHPDPAGMTVTMQVTEFICGGFVVGLMLDHTIADGVGMAQFMNAIAEIARGLEDPTVEPVWHREAIPKPPKAPPSPQPALPPTLPAIRNQNYQMDISLDHINHLKSQYLEQTGHVCSTFDILTAMVWQCRARSISLDTDVDSCLLFASNTRNLLSQSLFAGGAGYYGNCVYPMKVVAPRGKVAGASTIEAVSLIRDVKQRLSAEFFKWSEGDFVDDPYKPAFNHDFLFMVDWTRLGFDEVDFGWGKPAYVVPLLDALPGAVSYLVKPPAPGEGFRLITQCVAEEDMARFQDQMMKAFNVSAPNPLL